MTKYIIQLTKIIVVEIEAESAEEAKEYCVDKDGFEDSWHYAEPQCEVIEEGESK
jgi:hypothetical protein